MVQNAKNVGDHSKDVDAGFNRIEELRKTQKKKRVGVLILGLGVRFRGGLLVVLVGFNILICSSRCKFVKTL